MHTTTNLCNKFSALQKERGAMKNTFKHAFTLAEVLITLGIIGIIAAMTMPGIIQKQRQKALEVRFKKSYSVLSQILMRVKANWGEGIKRDFATVDENSLASTGIHFPRANEFIKLFYKEAAITGKCNYTKPVMNYNRTAEAVIDRGVSKPDMQLPDGSCINVQINASRVNITVDTNGAHSGPNTLGHDIFYFQIDNTDTLVPVKTVKKYEEDELDKGENPNVANQQGNPCYLSSKQKGNGIGCAWYALVNECPDNNGASYWECLP